MTFTNLSPAALSAILALGVVDYSVHTVFNEVYQVDDTDWLFAFANGHMAKVSTYHDDDPDANPDIVRWRVGVYGGVYEMCWLPAPYDSAAVYNLTDGEVVRCCKAIAEMPLW